MLFNSFEFLLFFPIVTVLYFIVPHRFRWLHLLVASCVFYMFFIPVYILILFFTIIIDYVAGILIERSNGILRKRYLLMSLVANIGVLAVFKYFNFFIGNVNTIFLHFHILPREIPLLNIILPIGLSFHTFQAMSYTIEVYRGNQKAEHHFGIYSLYVMFYPQLVAGPIERPQNLLPQFREVHHIDYDRMVGGIGILLWGLFKKVVIADRVAIMVNIVYTHPADYRGITTILTMVLFSIQIYCDFSGYSDMAIGSARVMGFKLMRNFSMPYASRSIAEFWTRWHISLSTWFKDYLYIPLGGNKVSKGRWRINIMIVFMISGLWHGANWTFLIWGLIHGAFIIISAGLKHQSHISSKHPQRKKHRLHTFVNILTTFTIVTVAWVFFRAKTISDAAMMLKNSLKLFPLTTTVILQGGFGILSLIISSAAILFLFIVEHKTKDRYELFEKKSQYTWAFHAVLLLLIVTMGIFDHQSFIYFQF